MNSTATISRTNLETLLRDDWLATLINGSIAPTDIEGVTLDIPDEIKVTVTRKPKEVAQLN